jgi:hypothetical protein
LNSLNSRFYGHPTAGMLDAGQSFGQVGRAMTARDVERIEKTQVDRLEKAHAAMQECRDVRSECATAPPEEIPNYLGRVRERAEVLHNLITALQSKLDPVLVPSCPSEDEKPDDPPVGTSIGVQLREIDMTLIGALYRLDGLRRRIAV